MGFPVLLKVTSNQLGAQGGVVILAVTLTRAPLLVPLTAMQGNLIAHFVDQRTARLRALLPPAALVGPRGGTASRVPTFTNNRSTGWVPSYAPAASPRLRRSHSPWPHRRAT